MWSVYWNQLAPLNTVMILEVPQKPFFLSERLSSFWRTDVLQWLTAEKCVWHRTQACWTALLWNDRIAEDVIEDTGLLNCYTHNRPNCWRYYTGHRPAELLYSETTELLKTLHKTQACWTAILIIDRIAEDVTQDAGLLNCYSQNRPNCWISFFSNKRLAFW